MVEYLLLVAMMISMVMLVFRNPQFQEMFGDEGRVGKVFSNRIACSYRYAIGDSKGRSCGNENKEYQSLVHPSYFWDGETRFFGPKSPYPGN